MKTFLVIAVFALISSPCWSRAVTEEESVVSIYTTPTAGSSEINVYSQIANNVAEKITSPIYRFFGIENSTETTTTSRPFEHIELQESKPTRTIANEIPDRDVEELSVEALKKTSKKPEKVSLYTSYLPIKWETTEKLETFNETRNEVDNDSDFDDDFNVDDLETPRGPFVWLLELAGSVIQLLWGGFLALFKPTSSSG